MEETPQYINNNSPEYDLEEYYLFKENKIYKISIELLNDNIIIKSNKYSINFNTYDLSLILKINFNSINIAYNYILNIFEKNNVTIKNISNKKEITLIFKLNNEKNIEFVLLYNEKKNNFIFNEIKELKKEIYNLKNENNKLKREINNLKIYHYKNPKNIKFHSNIVKNSVCLNPEYKTFTVFKSIDDLFYLIYYSTNISMICYELNERKIIKEIKNDICGDITNIKHYLDKQNKRDLILTLSSTCVSLKLYDVNDWKCILDIKNIYDGGRLRSSDFLNDNEQIYIITSHYSQGIDGKSGPIKIFDLNGKKIKEIKDSKDENTIFIISYYDNKINKNYIIAGYENLKSYDYNENKLYHNYIDNDGSRFFSNALIYDNEEIIKLITCGDNGNIKIWNFHSGLLINKINVCKEYIYDLCLWNDDYIFVGGGDKEIKLVNLKNGRIIKSLCGHKDTITNIKKIILPQYEECLISQEYKQYSFSFKGLDEASTQIKIWMINNN